MRNYIVKEESLTAIADSIRAKTGETEELVFPDGFKEAVDGIEVGIDKIKEALVSIGIEVGDGDTSTEVAEKIAENGFPIQYWNEKLGARYMNYMFAYCASLTTVPLFDTSNVTNTSFMFQSCASLTTVPLFDTSNVTNMSQMFQSCASLTTVPLLDTSNVTNMTYMFNGCSSLTECWLRNIKTNLTVGSGTSYGHLLTVESLLHLIKECRDTGSTKTLTIGTANMSKLANTYVKIIDVTDEMRAEDDLIDEKLPFEVCESTDEGAMLISEYVLLKNWQLK